MAEETMKQSAASTSCVEDVNSCQLIRSPNFERICASGEPCSIGIDEAGRGPVLGPMVYGVAVMPLASDQTLREHGVGDSKQLTEDKRDELFALFNESDCSIVAWAVRVISPAHLSRVMQQRVKYRLYPQLQCSCNDGTAQQTYKTKAMEKFHLHDLVRKFRLQTSCIDTKSFDSFDETGEESSIGTENEISETAAEQLESQLADSKDTIDKICKRVQGDAAQCELAVQVCGLCELLVDVVQLLTADATVVRPAQVDGVCVAALNAICLLLDSHTPTVAERLVGGRGVQVLCRLLRRTERNVHCFRAALHALAATVHVLPVSKQYDTEATVVNVFDGLRRSSGTLHQMTVAGVAHMSELRGAEPGKFGPLQSKQQLVDTIIVQLKSVALICSASTNANMCLLKDRADVFWRVVNQLFDFLCQASDTATGIDVYFYEFIRCTTNLEQIRSPAIKQFVSRRVKPAPVLSESRASGDRLVDLGERRDGRLLSTALAGYQRKHSAPQLHSLSQDILQRLAVKEDDQLCTVKILVPRAVVRGSVYSPSQSLSALVCLSDCASVADLQSDFVQQHVCAALNSRRTVTLAVGVDPDCNKVVGVQALPAQLQLLCQALDQCSTAFCPTLPANLLTVNRRPLLLQPASSTGKSSCLLLRKSAPQPVEDYYVLELCVTQTLNQYFQLASGQVYFYDDQLRPQLHGFEQARQKFIAPN